MSFICESGISQKRPNILIIIGDDIGIDAYGNYGIGSDHPSIPNLDSLMIEGLRFRNAWAYPTCAPTRAALLTGRYGNKNGITRSGPSLPNSESTLFEHIDSLTNSAYSNAVFGKWHLGNDNHPNINGVQHYDGNLRSGVDDYFEWERTINGVTDTSTSYVTEYITDEAINWVNNQSEPWLLCMSYNAAHGPVHLPPAHLYTRSDTSSNFDKYMCMIESMDHEIGRLYQSLTQEEKDSTLVIFLGDNGTPNSSLQDFPNRRGKGTVYEGGLRVPFFVSGYGVDRIGEIEDGMIHVVDVFATLTELLGVPLKGGWDNSFSFYNLLSNSGGATRNYNYSELTDDGLYRAIRNQRYKLISLPDTTIEFYDLLVDSLEAVDLSGSLNADLSIILDDLQSTMDSISTSWACNDGIRNGDEEGVDCGGGSCIPCAPLDTDILVAYNGISFLGDPSEELLHVHSLSTIYESQIVDDQGNVLFTLNPGTEVIDKSGLAGVTFLEIKHLANPLILLSLLLTE